MKKYRAALKKPQREESINSLDDLLEVLEDQVINIRQLSENRIISCTIVSIMIFSVFRLAEVIRSSALQVDDESWQLSTSTWKGGDDDVEIIFRKAKNQYTSPAFWITQLSELNKERIGSKNLQLFSKENKRATEEQGSKAVYGMINIAGIVAQYAIISTRSSSLTKQIAIGATKQQVNRITRHKKGQVTVAKFYDKNVNDGLRQKQSIFKKRRVSIKRFTLERSGLQRQSRKNVVDIVTIHEYQE
ncbi:MAG: hypothetical protein EZS28_020773 [Streblomastix strix]|uniref:Tyr recombinase domain-containing protein n=1 Tax=Streblomastix strix TaxID=222440 RepID=A0A5J4VM64_9EUKA|nr:MAG: hypothetical protein EZS28_020773 [Streblomastix strix]